MNQLRFFGGSTVHSGRANLLRAKTFRELVEGYIHAPVQFNMTRADFNQLTEAERNVRKDGGFICCCEFIDDESARKNEFAKAINFVVLDIDSGKDATNLFTSPETIVESVHPYSVVAWTTAKHTPEEPRIKIMVPVHPCDPSHLKRITAMIATRLGLPEDFKGFKESVVVTQPQYRPLGFQGEPFTSVIASYLDGESIDEKDAPEIRDAEKSPRIYAADPDILDLADLPNYNITVDDLREPLYSISPDCDYNTWREVACALRSNFPSEPEAQAAFELWLEWSMTSNACPGEGPLYRKWRSFAPTAKGRRSIRIATLYHLAKNAGWKDTKLSEKVQTNVKAWIAECTDAHLLLTEGAKRIAEMPFLNELVEEAMACGLRKKITELSGNAIDKATIRKAISKVRRKEVAQAMGDTLPPWMLPFCFIGPRNTFRNVTNGTEYGVEAFNNTFSRFLIAPKTDPDEPTSSRPNVLPSQKALNDSKIKIVDAELYDPRQASPDSYFEFNGRWYVNTFLKSSVPNEDATHSKLAGKILKEIIHVNLGNDKYERMMLDYFAFVVQNPGVLLRWAIFLQGAQGCGKGTIIDCVSAAIGQANVKVITATAMASDFNDWRAGSMFCHIDEIKAPGKNRFEIVNKIKDAITNTTIPVNQKFKDVVNIPNVTNYFLTSNNMDAIALEDSDRRFAVLVSLIQTREQVLAVNKSLIFERAQKLITDHPGAFRHFLMHHEISADFPVNGPAPETEFRQDLIDDAKNPLLTLIERLVADEDEPLVGDDVIHLSRLESLTSYAARDNARVTHYLRAMSYKRYAGGKVFTVAGEKTEIYIHTTRYCDLLGDPDELLEQRAEEGQL